MADDEMASVAKQIVYRRSALSDIASDWLPDRYQSSDDTRFVELYTALKQTKPRSEVLTPTINASIQKKHFNLIVSQLQKTMDPNPMNELEQQVMDAITANHQRIQESRTDEYEDGYVIPATGSYPMLSLNLAQTDLTEEDDPYPTDEEASQAYEARVTDPNEDHTLKFGDWVEHIPSGIVGICWGYEIHTNARYWNIIYEVPVPQPPGQNRPSNVMVLAKDLRRIPPPPSTTHVVEERE